RPAPHARRRRRTLSDGFRPDAFAALRRAPRAHGARRPAGVGRPLFAAHPARHGRAERRFGGTDVVENARERLLIKKSLKLQKMLRNTLTKAERSAIFITLVSTLRLRVLTTRRKGDGSWILSSENSESCRPSWTTTSSRRCLSAR